MEHVGKLETNAELKISIRDPLGLSLVGVIEINKNKQMKKEDLKTGMRVEYNNDLVRSEDIDCEYTINKVYRAPEHISMLIRTDCKGELLWEREEEMPEYTMAELHEKLGKFKIKK